VPARKVCSHIGPDGGCVNLQPCPLHERKPWASSDRAQRLPRGWAKKRRYVLLRDPLCSICGVNISTECDHIKPGDDHSYDNLQGVCVPCHRAKSQAEAEAARAQS
jgi:5-methylcytosine-specific restriction protein A